MTTLSSVQRKLVAEYLANIGVGWFIGGVIGVFVGEPKTIIETVVSISWGLLYSLCFLGSGLYVTKGVNA